MEPREFHLNPADYGLPTRDELAALRIWDGHFHGFMARGSVNPIRQYEQAIYFSERMGIERCISLDVGGTLEKPVTPSPFDAEIRALVERKADRLSALTPIDQGHPEASCAKIEKWVRDGPCIGIKYVAGNWSGHTCSHPDNDMIIRFAAELGAVIYIDSWLVVGGKPRRPGGGNMPGENTPMDVVKLAQRFPAVPMICGHSGGDWELGVRIVRPQKNVFLEFAGSDPHSGSVEYAVRELGVDRIVWGGHGPSRSYATELGKVLDTDLSRADRMKILGGNYRRLAAPQFQRKGWPLAL